MEKCCVFKSNKLYLNKYVCISIIHKITICTFAGFVSEIKLINPNCVRIEK